ncbi:hypothetical protein [Azohydromonas caseinilytica]|uniref:Uncharacterized protein n=1 Tax=Azohydromonas caseinilytica TaxID=2728836 RepID=A0A848F856_9BURK|nr:hypothetical protein [Azohydromonas caseinilytica]NML15378.1 hypothetical protein [Azohydromonas caseinilytica]
MAFLPMTGSCKRLLLGTAAATLGLPLLLGEFAKHFMQPGLSDDPVRQQLLVDYIVIGALVFGLTMILTVAIGCWVRRVMQGPARSADPYPLPHEDPRARSQ